MKTTLWAFMLTVSALLSAPLQKGEKAPDFSLIDEKGTNHSLYSTLETSPVVIVFYPGDNTPRCTQQLCELRDNYDSLLTFDSVQVYGINNDSQESHNLFKIKNKYPFPLLIDEDWNTASSYGVAGGLMGVKRHVFIIDKNGIIQFAKSGKPPVEEIMATLKELYENK